MTTLPKYNSRSALPWRESLISGDRVAVFVGPTPKFTAVVSKCTMLQVEIQVHNFTWRFSRKTGRRIPDTRQYSTSIRPVCDKVLAVISINENRRLLAEIGERSKVIPENVVNDLIATYYNSISENSK